MTGFLKIQSLKQMGEVSI